MHMLCNLIQDHLQFHINIFNELVLWILYFSIVLYLWLNLLWIMLYHIIM